MNDEQERGRGGEQESKRARASLTPLLSFSLPLLIALWLYAPTLRLPLVYDTLLHTQLAQGLDWVSVWLPSEQFGFYRPLVFAPLLLIEQLFGGYPAWLLHGLNMGQHALNSALLAIFLAIFSQRTVGSRHALTLRYGLVSGLLLATFPFAYQAVIVYGNNAYLTVTGLLLLGLLLDETLQHKAWLRFSAVALVFGVGVLVHETAVLLIPLVWLKQLVHGTRYKVQGSWLPLAPCTLHHALLGVLLLLYLLIYFSLETGGGPLLDYGGNDPWVKLLLFAQTAAWPLAWLAHWFPEVSAVGVIVPSTAVTLLLTLFILVRQPTSRPLLLFGWGWWLGASLLIALTLPTYYIADGARLLYPGAPGLAIAWGVMVVAVGQELGRITRPWITPLTTGFLVLILALQGGSFVRGMIGVYEWASAPTTAVVKQLQAENVGADTAVVLVNWPQWLAPPRNTFPLGTEFAPVLGDHLFAYELLRANTGTGREVYNLLVPDLLQETAGYHYGVYQATAVDKLPPLDAPQTHLFITTYEETVPTARHTGDLLIAPPPTTLLAMLGPWQLHQATACPTADGVQTELHLTLPDPAALPPTASFFVQLLAPDGRLLAQADGPALGVSPDRLPILEDVLVVDKRLLVVPAGEMDLEMDTAVVLIGLYDYLSGERLPSYATDGSPLPDDAFRLPVCE